MLEQPLDSGLAQRMDGVISNPRQRSALNYIPSFHVLFVCNPISISIYLSMNIFLLPVCIYSYIVLSLAWKALHSFMVCMYMCVCVCVCVYAWIWSCLGGCPWLSLLFEARKLEWGLKPCIQSPSSLGLSHIR
jgi:hypothetical protein